MSSNIKQGLVIGGAVLVLASAAWWTYRQARAGEAETHYRILMDGETGEIVKIPHSRESGSYPLENPQTGRKTLYPTEICFWNGCGPEGTRVILNHWLNKEGPTLCPKCGREVTRRNPVPPEMRHKSEEVEKPEDVAKAAREAQSGGE